MFKSFMKLIFVSSIFTSLFACSLSPDEMTLLETSTMSYERAIRWGEFDRAKAFHKSASKMSDIERRRLKLYRVTGYSTLQTETPDTHNSYVLVEIKYLKIDRQVVKNITVKQHWKRDKNGKIWYLDSPFPKLR